MLQCRITLHTTRMSSHPFAPLRRILVPLRRRWRRSTLAQVLALIGLWALCDAIVRGLNLHFPAGVLGMVLLLAMLFLRWVRLPSLQRGAGWLLGEMLLFVIPAMPVLIDHPEFIGWLGVKLLFAVVIGTLLVMAATGLAVDFCVRLVEKPAPANHDETLGETRHD